MQNRCRGSAAVMGGGKENSVTGKGYRSLRCFALQNKGLCCCSLKVLGKINNHEEETSKLKDSADPKTSGHKLR